MAPQNDICPHGTTYPTNVVGMLKNRITTPTDHVCMELAVCSYYHYYY